MSKNRGPEILDFRDSWLREIAMYQDHVKAHQMFAHVNENKGQDQIGGHFKTAKITESKLITRNKTGVENEAPEKEHQYIVNTYHAHLLKKENKPQNISNKRQSIKDKAKIQSDVKMNVSDRQKSSARLKRRKKSTTRQTNKNFQNHPKMVKSPKRRNKIRSGDKPNEHVADFQEKTIENINHFDMKFSPNELGADFLATTRGSHIIVNPYHAKLIFSNKDHRETALPTKTATPLSLKKESIPEAYTILENIHRTLKTSKSQQQQQLKQNEAANIEAVNEILAVNVQLGSIPPIAVEPTADVQTLLSTVAASSTAEKTSTKTNAASAASGNDDDSDNRNNAGTDFDDDLGDFIDDDEQTETSSSDSETEFKGHVYMSDDADDFPASCEISSLHSGDTSVYYTPSSILAPSLFPNCPPYITFSSHAEKGPPIPSDLHRILKWKMTKFMPKIVRYVVANTGFRLLRKTNDWMGTWDKHLKSPGFREIRHHQKFNHLPGSLKIGRKDSIWRNLKLQINKFGKKEFGFMRKTYILPQDLPTLRRSWYKLAKQRTKWIVKPPASARGFGIHLVSKWTEIPHVNATIIQKYIERPLLINGNKFDLRLYVLITSINPLRIFLHNEGLARFASVQYSNKMDTIHNRCMHLTNYSVNKFSENYVKNEDINSCDGHKWSLKSLWSYLRTRNIDTRRVWGMIRDLVVRTVIIGENGMNRIIKTVMNSNYNCYELFGFDVLLDENLTPWLIEVNISPSLHIELPLDRHIKGPLVQAVLNTACFQVPPRLTKQQQKEILTQFNLSSPLCYDRRIYVNALSPDEAAKHKRFTSDAIECRNDYLDAILESLTPDDLRCLIVAEDELSRCSPMERLFPSANSNKFLQFTDEPRYYNRLLDAWETRYASNRDDGIKILRKICLKGSHLKVPASALISTFQDTIDEESDEDV